MPMENGTQKKGVKISIAKINKKKQQLNAFPMQK